MFTTQNSLCNSDITCKMYPLTASIYLKWRDYIDVFSVIKPLEWNWNSILLKFNKPVITVAILYNIIIFLHEWK